MIIFIKFLMSIYLLISISYFISFVKVWTREVIKNFDEYCYDVDNSYIMCYISVLVHMQ